jgi:hypothetical protein
MLLTRKTALPLFGLLVLALCLLELWVVRSAHFPRNPELFSLVVTVDITLGIPLLFYLFVARPRRLPLVTVAPVFLIALGIASLLLPRPDQGYLNLAKQLVPLIEILVLGFVLLKARAVAAAYRETRVEAVYGSEALAAALGRVLGRSPAIPILMTELSLLYYALAGWFREYRPPRPSLAVFSYHRNSHYPAMLLMLAFILVPETIGVHLLVSRWSEPLAWLFTVMSVYTGVWLVGDYQAARLHPVVLDPHGRRLHLRAGLRWRVSLPLSAIVEARRGVPAEKSLPAYLNMAAGEPRLLLVLREPVVVEGVLGIKRTARHLGLSLDEEARFVAQLGEAGDEVMKGLPGGA